MTEFSPETGDLNTPFVRSILRRVDAEISIHLMLAEEFPPDRNETIEQIKDFAVSAKSLKLQREFLRNFEAEQGIDFSADRLS